MAQDPWPVDWRRNLAILWFAQFTAIFGFSFAFPFLPIFLSHDLGVTDTHQLAVWTGIAGAASGAALAVLSPVWGVLADRYGRKSMLIRAMVGGGVMVGAIAFARTPLQLVGLRFLQGAFSGTVAATTTLVAAGTPRDRVGWSMGILSSAVALGGAVGPFAGGVAAGIFGLRVIFLAGGVLLLVAVVPVIFMVREMPFRQVGRRQAALLPALRAAPGGLLAVAVLLAAQSLLQISWSGSQPLVALKLLTLVTANTTTLTGLAFAASGAASAGAAFIYSSVARRSGYRTLCTAAALLAALSLVLMAAATNAPVVILATLLSGFFFGALGPAVSAMLGLEAPAEVQGRVFGFSASATALGFALGPLIGGLIAGLVNVPVALLVAAAFAVVLAVEMALLAREPAK